MRVAEFAEARKENPDLLLVDYLGNHSWLGQVPTFAAGSPRQGEAIPPAVLNALIKTYLRRGKAVILLDGLDELARGTSRDAIVSAIEAFIQDCVCTPAGLNPFNEQTRPWKRIFDQESPTDVGGNQLIITSRIAGYHESPIGGYLAHYTIEPMESSAIDRFCDAWSLSIRQLLVKSGESQVEVDNLAHQQAKALKAAIHDPSRPGVAEMASNPLLLTIIALVHHSTQARLPEQRFLLYQIAVKNLVDVWRESDLKEDEVVSVLAPIAAYIHDRYSSGLIPEPELRILLTRHLATYRGLNPAQLPPIFHKTVEAWLTTIREQVGILAARGEYHYGFLHLTFQEYLAARYLVRNPKTALKNILKYIDDPRWREPVVLAMAEALYPIDPKARERFLFGILDAHDPLADLLPFRVLLVVAALPELVQAPRRVMERVTEQLLEVYADREGIGRFEYLRREIETVLDRLHRGEIGAILDRMMVKALSEATVDQPFKGLAAAELVVRNGWATPVVITHN